MLLNRRERAIVKAGIDPYRLEDPTSPEIRAVNKKERRHKAIVVCCFMALVLAVCAAFVVAKQLAGPAYAPYATQTIHIVGLADDEFDISVEELGQMECEYVNAKGVSTDGGETGTGSASGYGPTLKTIMAAYGKASSDFKRIRFSCKDGYAVALSGKKVEYDAVLSISLGNSSLPENQQPARIIIPKESSGQWAYGVNRIEFVS